MRPRKEDAWRAAETIEALSFDPARYDCADMDAIDWWVCLEYRSHLRAQLLIPEWESAASRRIKSIAQRFGMSITGDPDGEGVREKLLAAMANRAANETDYGELMAAYDALRAETTPRLIARDSAVEVGRVCLHRALRDVRPSLSTMQMVERLGGSVATARTPAVRRLLANPLLSELRREVREAMAHAVTEKCVRDATKDKSASWQLARLEGDLRVGDEVLKNGFERWLAAVRQRCEREGVTAAPVRRAPLERWSRYRILGFIDLQFASDALNLSVSDSALGRLLFPDPNKLGGKQDDPRRLRRTVREVAMDVMTYATLVEVGYEVQYDVQRLAGGLR